MSDNSKEINIETLSLINPNEILEPEPELKQKSEKEEDISLDLEIDDLLINKLIFEALLSKSEIQVDEENLNKILKVLNELKVLTNNTSQLNIIIKEVIKLLSNGVIELYRIPELIKVVYDNINKSTLDGFELDDVTIAQLVKLVVVILIEFKIVETDAKDYKIIIKTIDTAILLLKIDIKSHIENIKNLKKLKKVKEFKKKWLFF